jgi:hypothetical protein
MWLIWLRGRFGRVVAAALRTTPRPSARLSADSSAADSSSDAALRRSSRAAVYFPLPFLPLPTSIENCLCSDFEIWLYLKCCAARLSLPVFEKRGRGCGCGAGARALQRGVARLFGRPISAGATHSLLCLRVRGVQEGVAPPSGRKTAPSDGAGGAAVLLPAALQPRRGSSVPSVEVNSPVFFFVNVAAIVCAHSNRRAADAGAPRILKLLELKCLSPPPCYFSSPWFSPTGRVRCSVHPPPRPPPPPPPPPYPRAQRVRPAAFTPRPR